MSRWSSPSRSRTLPTSWPDRTARAGTGRGGRRQGQHRSGRTGHADQPCHRRGLPGDLRSATTPAAIPTTSTSGGTAELPTNFNKFDDPEINALLDEGRAETDPAKRQEIYEEINREFASEVYNLWLNWTEWTIATQTDVHGIVGPILPDGQEPFPGLADGHSLAGAWISG